MTIVAHGLKAVVVLGSVLLKVVRKVQQRALENVIYDLSISR